MLVIAGASAREYPGRGAQWIDTILVACVVVAMRIPSFSRSVIDWDESVYAVVGRVLLEGKLPYVVAFEIKPFGTFLAMAGAMALFGTNVIAIRLLGLIAVCASCVLLQRVGLRIGLSRLAAISCGILYVLVTSYLGGLATNIEILFAPFSISAFLLLLNLPDAQARSQCLSGNFLNRMNRL